MLRLDTILLRLVTSVVLLCVQVQPSSRPAASGPPENSLADALARALAERSRVIHSESSTSDEDEDDDDEWED